MSSLATYFSDHYGVNLSLVQDGDSFKKYGRHIRAERSFDVGDVIMKETVTFVWHLPNGGLAKYASFINASDNLTAHQKSLICQLGTGGKGSFDHWRQELSTAPAAELQRLWSEHRLTTEDVAVHEERATLQGNRFASDDFLVNLWCAMQTNCYRRQDGAFCLFLCPSLLQHSCSPSARWDIHGNEIVITCIRPIEAGDAVSQDYYGVCNIKSVVARKLAMPFACNCDRCIRELHDTHTHTPPSTGPLLESDDDDDLEYTVT
eukprot:GILJ01008154.1.p1 GENE.GILJ01008154.1~~GILJ01008154.1.p1  ORF type:complete len:271 (-),score=20.68 GILJ01008154.1:261-1046(-)